VTHSSGKPSARKRSSVRRSAVRTTPLIPTARRPDIHPLDRAIAELRAELARTPEDPTLLGRLGALFYRRGDLKEAEKQYRRALELAPHRASLHNNLGNVLCDMGRMRDGIACYEQAMAVEKAQHPDRPPSSEALTNLEMARTEYRLIQERIEYLERAAQLDVTSAEALNALGCGYLLRGWTDKALAAFRKGARMDPRNTAAGLNIAFTHTLNHDADDINEALAETAEFAIRFPHEPRLHIHQGELLESAGMMDEAEQRYLRAVQADPRCLEGYDLLGKLREVTGYSGANDATSSACEKLLKGMEDAARALRQEERSLSASALFDLAFVAVARAKFSRKPLANMPEVDTLLREAISAGRAESGASSSAASAAMLRAQMLETEGRRADAITVLDSAIHADVGNGRLCFERGSMALRAGDVDQALSSFERATLALPQDAVCCHSLRFAFEGFRRYKTERVRFETAVRANPRDGLAHHHMALASLSVLKDEEALFHFTRALELDPRLSDAACGRGRALQRLGHLAEAEAAYAKALDIDPENAEAQRSLLALRSQKLMNTLVSSLPRA